MDKLIFQKRQTRTKGVIEAGRLQELHLYPGNQCNRDCSFCTVFGSPKGWVLEYTTDHLEAALQVVFNDERGTLKFYGGEPTLHDENLIWAIQYLRDQGYAGAIVIYSNGIQAEKLIRILESDPLGQTTASLNYSITTGNGAAQMPQHSLATLTAYEQSHPNTIAIGHPEVLDSGRGTDPFQGETDRTQISSQCPHCYPVLTTSGIFHACPFAIENSSPHFRLGDLSSDPAQISENFRIFLDWLDQVHEPYARQHQLPACTVCWKHLADLSTPGFV